jgi:hypothetical protein
VHGTAVWSIAVQHCLTDHRRKTGAAAELLACAADSGGSDTRTQGDTRERGPEQPKPISQLRPSLALRAAADS